MKLVDYLADPENKLDLPEKGLEKFRENAFLCEIHQEDLIVVDGFQIICCDITFDYDPGILKGNPNAIWLYDSLEEPVEVMSEPAKLVYCPTCESGKQDWSESTRPVKKKKGRKSKKYD